MATEKALATGDVATSSNYHDVLVNHYNFYFNVNIEAKEIFTYQKTSCIAQKKITNVLLDVYKTIKVNHIRSVEGCCLLDFSIEPFTHFGQTLNIKLHEKKEPGDQFSFIIEYVTSPGPGLVWLEPAQTAGKKMSFIYTQGEPVFNRSVFPCQDTPSVKSTYSANIKIPDGYSAVMSADIESIDSNNQTLYFEQTNRIPAYLMTFAVGDIQKAVIGPRSAVYAESCMLEKAKLEFSEVVEEFLQTGEKLFGKYVWNEYNILVMPTSYPFGGMENPCMTSITPCLLAGDKSLTYVVIHEICHSWFGNLVTNANWSEFWLNEGFTVYATRRMLEELYGKPYMCLEASLGQNLLEEMYVRNGEEHEFNRLRMIINHDVNPDDTYNEVPYEKGCCFVMYLEHLAGDRAKFDSFLRDYLEKFKFKSVVSEEMLELYLHHFPHLKAQVEETSEFEDWLASLKRPPFKPDFSAGITLTKVAKDLVEELTSDEPKASVDISQWKTLQRMFFLDLLVDKSPLKEATLKKFIDAFPSIIESKNSEIILRWSKIIIRNNLTTYRETIRDFLKAQGKIKYTEPIYAELKSGSDEWRSLAKDMFAETHDQLHESVQRRVERVLSSE